MSRGARHGASTSDSRRDSASVDGAIEMVTVVKSGVTVHARDVERLYRHSLKGRSIFNPDNLRKQAPLRRTNRIVRDVVQCMRERNLLQDGCHTLGGAVVLHSLAGCKQQSWHTDWDPAELHRMSHKPFGVIVAIEDGTRFVTPKRSYALNRGDILCFDGDEVHAGAKYDAANTRIHMYVDVPHVKRRRDRTWIVEMANT